MDRLKDKVVIITGTTSGIGRAAARLFAAEGAKLVTAARRKERGDALAAELTAQGYTVDFVQTDITQQDQTDALVKFTMEKYGRIDVLCNNAAYGGREHYLMHEYTDEVCKKYMDTNILGAMHLCRAVIPIMIQQGGGNIVNTASVGAEIAVPFDCVYSATKGAIRQMTKTIAVEYAPQGIRCNCVLPGLTRTEMIPDGGEVEEMIIPTIPMGRICQPEEIAYALLFLATNECPFCNGASLIVDGAQSLN